MHDEIYIDKPKKRQTKSLAFEVKQTTSSKTTNIILGMFKVNALILNWRKNI